MRPAGRRRKVSAATGLVLLGALVLVPVLGEGLASASGGGGCGRPVTDARGTGVDIRGYCFSPTILRVSTGEAVTFTNVDPVPHSVLGANATWGDYAGFKKKSVTYRFSEPGVYPYVCTYHLGMVGAAVVGDGVGGAIDTSTADGPVTRWTPPTSGSRTRPPSTKSRRRPAAGCPWSWPPCSGSWSGRRP